MIVSQIVMVIGVEAFKMMNVAYVMVIIPSVQIVQAYPMVITWKMNAVLVIVTLPMTVCRIVPASGVDQPK